MFQACKSSLKVAASGSGKIYPCRDIVKLRGRPKDLNTKYGSKREKKRWVMIQETGESYRPYGQGNDLGYSKNFKYRADCIFIIGKNG